ncbi:MAG: hypothetical protein V2A74_00085, partial [bacterium]
TSSPTLAPTPTPTPTPYVMTPRDKEVYEVYMRVANEWFEEGTRALKAGDNARYEEAEKSRRLNLSAAEMAKNGIIIPTPTPTPTPTPAPTPMPTIKPTPTPSPPPRQDTFNADGAPPVQSPGANVPVDTVNERNKPIQPPNK